MLNRNKANIAYNIIDLDGTLPSNGLVDKLKEVEGIISVRILP